MAVLNSSSAVLDSSSALPEIFMAVLGLYWTFLVLDSFMTVLISSCTALHWGVKVLYTNLPEFTEKFLHFILHF